MEELPKMLHRSIAVAIQKRMFSNAFVVHSRYVLVEDATHQHYLCTTNLPVKSLEFKQF